MVKKNRKIEYSNSFPCVSDLFPSKRWKLEGNMKTNIRDISIYFYAYPISFHSYVHLRLLVGEDRPCIRSNGCIVVVDAFFLSFLANCKYAAWHLVVNLTVEADRGQVDNVAAASSQRQGLAAGSDLDRISSCWPAQRTRRLRAERESPGEYAVSNNGRPTK